ncbi:WG repeat-containing protein [Hymenobacter armeniacus]|uniref:WG repeat-containing protein n=1 Tax=Hymenobacter armeniacus TaxID=2771358 RepID=A0ABR8JVA3_9BACT|nr:WG repeat-containing protein [Hymenobacter armeniacus]MBD2722447.1 WG repeat-containing protein [Hymenobacter armeniacus]
MKALVLSALFGWPAAGAQPALARFPFEERGRWGFIDSTGAVVIAPRFAQVHGFSEGLAAVREQDLYGYIDATGQFVIAPRFEAAAEFHSGRAVVRSQHTGPQLIDRAGRLQPLPSNYQSLRWLPGPDRGGLWLGTLKEDCQVLDAQGRLLNPTHFREVEPLACNRMVVKGTKLQRPLHLPGNDPEDAEDYAELPTGVLDGRGRWVIPFGRFDHISTFRDGLALATVRPNPKARQPNEECLIDTTGRIVAFLPKGELCLPSTSSEFSDGTAPVRVGDDPSVLDDSRSYPAAIDGRGRVLFRQPSLRQLSPFVRGRAWAREADRDQWFLLNKAGRRLNSVVITSILSDEWPTGAPTFAGGVELVAVADGYAALDTLGQVLRQLPEPDFADGSPRRIGDLLLFSQEDSAGTRFGYWNWRTGQLVGPRFSAVANDGFAHGLLAVAEGPRWGYFTPAGTYAWQQPASGSAPLNLDYMRRAFYPVASAPLAKFAGFGGWGRSGNRSRPLPDPRFAPRAVSLRVDAQPMAAAFEQRVDGHRLYLANTTADTVVFDAQDSSLFLTLQARDAQGQWHDIEYNPSSFCGNSYHQVFLAPDQCWQLVVPAYAGGQPTQLRARLRASRGRSKGQRPDLYSNPFAGSVNPAQFWRTEGHSPLSIMDPYLN